MLEDAEWIPVEKNSFQRSGSDILGVDHLGSCIGLGFHDPQESEVALLHLGTRENDELEELVEQFLSGIDFREPYEAVAGGTISSRYDPLLDSDVYEQARDVVENALEDNGFSYQTAWNEKPVYNRMVVSPEHGILYDETV